MKTSKLEVKLEALAYTSDIGDSLDTTDESEHSTDHEFEADEVLAQRVDEDVDPPVVEYLVKYTDYPMHRCTWEPRKHLKNGLFQTWKDKRSAMGLDERTEMDRKYRQMFDDACARAEAAKARRHHKREVTKKEAHSKEQKGVARKIIPSTRSDRGPIIKREGESILPGKKRRVVTSSDDEMTLDGSSSSSDSEPLIQRRLKRKESIVARQSRPSSPQPRRKSLAVVPSLMTTDKIAERTENTAESSNDGLLGKSLNNTAKPASFAERRKSMPTPPTGPAADRLKAPHGPGAGPPIKLLNQKKPPPRVWNTQNKHFTTLQYRRIAEKRGRMEGTPDPDQLDFVNGTPPLPTKNPASTDLYGRRELAQRREPAQQREPAQRRLREVLSDNEPTPKTENIALRPYEVGKVPQACYEWTYSTCVYGAQYCHFLHREKNQDGETLPIAPWDSSILPKYKKPPETCFYWFSEGSCNKPTDICKFAHDNTGWLVLDGRPRQINPKILPGSNQAREICGLPPKHNGKNYTLPKSQFPPLTCFFWLRGDSGCDKTEEKCIYAHRNTGWLAFLNKKSMQIDPNEGPKAARVTLPSSNQNVQIPNEGPKAAHATLPYLNQYVPLHMKTCFFWNEYACRETDATCRSLHRYTGIVADPPPGYVRSKPPRQQLRRDEEPISGHSQHVPTPQEHRSITAPFDHFNDNAHTKDDDDDFEASMEISSEDALSPRGRQASSITITKDFTNEIPDEVALRLEYEEMFVCNGDQEGDIPVQPNALVLYDAQKTIREHALIVRWLQLRHVTVYDCHNEWDAFRKLIQDGGSGIVIAAPEFESYAGMPGFGDVLRGTVRLWSIGQQEVADFSIWNTLAPSQERQYDRFEIFPHGGIIYITDDVFLYKPQLALEIFKLFFAMIEAGRDVDVPTSDIVAGMYINDGILLWRLGVRPDLLRWIGDHCMNHLAESERGDPDIVSLNELYVLLTDSGYSEPDSSLSNLPPDNRRLDFFPIISAHQQVAQEAGLYYEAKKRSQHDANTDMANHYSEFLIAERRLYRHYFIVHTKPEEVDWKETITNIDEVMTPEKCVEYFKQEPKGNKFENYAWTYPKSKDALANA